MECTCINILVDLEMHVNIVLCIHVVFESIADIYLITPIASDSTDCSDRSIDQCIS